MKQTFDSTIVFYLSFTKIYTSMHLIETTTGKRFFTFSQKKLTLTMAAVVVEKYFWRFRYIFFIPCYQHG